MAQDCGLDPVSVAQSRDVQHDEASRVESTWAEWHPNVYWLETAHMLLARRGIAAMYLVSDVGNTSHSRGHKVKFLPGDLRSRVPP